jgi:hypothetical protein
MKLCKLPDRIRLCVWAFRREGLDGQRFSGSRWLFLQMRPHWRREDLNPREKETRQEPSWRACARQRRSGSVNRLDIEVSGGVSGGQDELQRSVRADS